MTAKSVHPLPPLREHGYAGTTGERLLATTPPPVRVVRLRLHACGLHSCVDCGRLTEGYWKDAAMCNACQDRNPSIQQIKAML